MIQCLVCEDWLHESCLNLRERLSSCGATPAPENPAENSVPGAENNDDAQSEASSSGLPRPLITGTDYDALICSSCVLRIPILKRWAGTEGTMMVFREGPLAAWQVLKGSGSNAGETISVTQGAVEVGIKRPLSPPTVSAEHDSKKQRLGPESIVLSSSSVNRSCLAPPINFTAQRILAALETKDPDSSQSNGTGDIFLTGDWRSRWCRCELCLPQLLLHPYLLEEEETYEPPEDPDSRLSLEELGARALERIPRDKALDGIRAFNDMRDDLVKFLRPFAQQGKVVEEEDIKGFFESKIDAARRGREY
ncbi:hypothetical protein EW146_g8573 [Bondarzewia mesenterica]|uniref:Uncharacterized protein n=1 Tax=Bondarzewia mesenterica TaxID=1095465 RepID=A0A4S4LDU6_9AGAM|nr:hypothetical protein EW146_g8573 [Bondarzewia mesenterica]